MQFSSEGKFVRAKHGKLEKLAGALTGILANYRNTNLYIRAKLLQAELYLPCICRIGSLEYSRHKYRGYKKFADDASTHEQH